jgi:hypothetical protein
LRSEPGGSLDPLVGAQQQLRTLEDLVDETGDAAQVV